MKVSMGILLFFLVLTAEPFFFALFYQKKFQEMIAISGATVVLISFFCGLLGFLKESVYIIIGLTTILWIASLIRLIWKKGFHNLSHFFNPAFGIFVLVFIFLLFVHSGKGGRLLHLWDEFSHWGDVVKVMVNIDDLSTNPHVQLLFPSYMPGMALFQYFFQKLQIIFSGAIFSDWGLYFCYHLFSCMLLLTLFTATSWKQFFTLFFLFCCTAVIPSFLNPEYLSSIYIDGFVGVLGGVGFALLYQNERSSTTYANLLTVCIMLVLAKDVGLALAVIIGCALVVQEYVCGNKSVGIEKKRIMLIAVLTLISILLPKILWEINIRNNQARTVFRTPIELDTLFKVLLGIDHSYRRTVRNNFLSKLISGRVVLGGISVSITYLILFLLICGVLLVIHSWHNRKDCEMKIGKRRNIALITMIVSLLIYTFGLLVIYLFRFDTYESVNLASFDRYMSIILDALIIALLLITIVYFQTNKFEWKKQGLCFAMVTFLLIPPVELYRYISRESIISDNEVQMQYQEIVSKMNALSGGHKKAVWVIAQESNGREIQPIRYGIRPCETQTGFTWSLSAEESALYDGDIWTCQISAEQWKKELKNYDYVMIWKDGESFRKDYGQLFENPNSIGSEKIYRVDHERNLLIDCDLPE